MPAPLSLPDRVLRLGGRRLAALPTRVVARLAGAPRSNSRGDTLDPQAHLALELERLLGLPPLDSLPVPEARCEMLRTIRLAEADAPTGVNVEPLSVRGGSGTTLGARAYRRARAPRPSPGLVYFHGGGFVLGDLDTHDTFCRFLAHAARVTVIAVDYRRAPEHRFPAAAEDAVASFADMHRRADELGLDPARLAVGGDSAGGNLSAVVTQAARDGAAPMPAFALLLYPGVDFVDRTRSREEFAGGVFLTDALIEWFLSHYFARTEDRLDVRASPGRASSLDGLPPTHIVTAGFDPLRDEGEAYAERLRTAGVAVTYQLEPGLIHGFLQTTGIVDAARSANDRIARTLQRALRA